MGALSEFQLFKLLINTLVAILIKTNITSMNEIENMLEIRMDLV